MPLPGISEQNKLIPLLRMLISDKEEVFKFGVAASSPKEGVLCMSKKEKLKKKEVKSEAEADAKAANGGKAVKLEVMTGECHRDEQSETTLRLVVYGKAPAKAVACIEHLLVRGPYKVAGFKGVIIEEVADEDEEAPPAQATTETVPPGAPPDPAAEWNKALAAIEPDYLKGVRDRPDLASKLRAVMDFAQGKAEVKDYKTAIVALQKLVEVLRGKPSAAASEGKTTATATATADASEIAKPAVVARLAAQTDKIAAVARPTAAPKQALTNDLVADIASMDPPARIEDLPNFIAQFVPKFLMTTVSELSQGSQALPAGAALPAQDQTLVVADLFGAAQLCLQAWETLLKEGEAGQTQLDQMDKAKGQRDEKAEAEYVAALERYNLARTSGLAEQTRTLKKVQDLMAEYKGLQAAKA